MMSNSKGCIEKIIYFHESIMQFIENVWFASELFYKSFELTGFETKIAMDDNVFLLLWRWPVAAA